jgi:calcineurin-like phosphoesterase family protein
LLPDGVWPTIVGVPLSTWLKRPMPVYFTSDNHFGHSGARGLYRRPFESASEMDQVMIDRWNSLVKPDDEIWHLGDFAVRQSPERVACLLTVLNGRKHLIAGNNDDEAVTGCFGWASVQPYKEATIDRKTLVLCHYPFRTWRHMGKGSINLHGHSHGRLKPMPRQFDVGVDAWDFRPVGLLDLIGQSRVRSGGRSRTAC